ncbi:MAG: hypothetical protein M3336_07635 [Chloroflexota bacterium]|nr:hypothetical protein [Chloroflexota bacterium]
MVARRSGSWKWEVVLGGALALTAVAAAAAMGRAWADLQHQTSELAVTTSRGAGSAVAIPDLASLTRLADLVVVGRVAGEGATRLEVQPAQTPIPFQPLAPPAGPSGGGKAGEPVTPPPRAESLAQAGRGAGPAIPITAYPVEVERVVRGGAGAGQQVTVVQTGGTFSVPVVPGGPSVTRTLQVEDDALMRVGERYVLFLRRNGDGTFAIVGGPQGRMLVDSGGRVHPVAGGSPATSGRDGQAVDTFVADVAAIH